MLTDRRPGRCPDEQRRERNPTPGSRSPARGSTAVVALSPGRWWSWVKAAKLETLPGELWRTRSPFWSVKPHVASVPSTRVLPQHNYSHFFRELFYFHDLQLTGPSELGKSLREHPQTHFCPAGPRRSAATCALHWSLRVPKGSNPDLGDEQRSSRLREQGDEPPGAGVASRSELRASGKLGAAPRESRPAGCAPVAWEPHSQPPAGVVPQLSGPQPPGERGRSFNSCLKGGQSPAPLARSSLQALTSTAAREEVPPGLPRGSALAWLPCPCALQAGSPRARFAPLLSGLLSPQPWSGRSFLGCSGVRTPSPCVRTRRGSGDRGAPRNAASKSGDAHRPGRGVVPSLSAR